jgi:preprotein translocase subunit YajC
MKLNILLQATTEGNPLIFFVLVFGVFWFFMIRPQVKKQKKERKFREEIKKGDKVVTTGGVHGKIAEVSDKTVMLDVAEGLRLKVDLTAITPFVTEAPSTKK